MLKCPLKQVTITPKCRTASLLITQECHIKPKMIVQILRNLVLTYFVIRLILLVCK